MNLAKKINRGKVRKIRLKRVGQSTQNFSKVQARGGPGDQLTSCLKPCSQDPLGLSKMAVSGSSKKPGEEELHALQNLSKQPWYDPVCFTYVIT